MRIRLLLLLFLISSSAFAQLDDKFWFAVPEATSSHADDPAYLRITAGVLGASITISVPANPNLAHIILNLNSNQFGTIDLTPILDSLENISPCVVTKRGLFIESDNPVKIYYELLGVKNSAISNSEIFTLKGRHALGLDFYCPFQNIYQNGGAFGITNAYSSIDIVATEDSTTITVTPTNPVFNIGNSPFTFVLNKGETYSVRANGIQGSDHLGGTRVQSDKPIAITLKDDSAGDYKGFDIIGDQLVPARELGTEFILINDNINYTTRELYAISTEDNNTVRVNGNIQTTLNKGEQNNIDIFSQTSFIESEYPMYVFVVSSNYVESAGAVLPHLNCTGEKEFSYYRGSSEGMTMSILVPNGSENDFTSSIGMGNWSFSALTSNTNWMFAHSNISISDLSVHDILTLSNSSGKFHVMIEQGTTNSANRLGYFASYSSLDFGISLKVCDETILDAGFGRDTYLWNTGETSQTIQVDTTGEYWVEISDHGCLAKDTVLVNVSPGANVELRSDTTICDNETLTLSSFYDDSLSYLWNTGSTDTTITVSKKGRYWLKVTNKYDCYDLDTVVVETISLPEVGPIKDTISCENEITFNIIKDDGTSPSWIDENGNVISTTHTLSLSTTSEVTAQTENICGISSKSIKVEFREHIIPNIITPNNDGVNDDFQLTNFGSGEWSFKIYNRWGKLIDSNEDFKGNWNNPTVPDNVYYYTVEDRTCDELYKGWLQIIR